MVDTYKKIEKFETYSESDWGNVRNDQTGLNFETKSQKWISNGSIEKR